MTALEAALAQHQRGFIIQAAHRATHPSGGKHPLATGWQNAERLSTPDVYATWDVENPPNISVLTGERAGIFVIDIDGADGATAMNELVTRLGVPPDTYTVRTASGSTHLYYRQPPGVHVPSNKSRLGAHIDLRGDGGHVIGPGSVAFSKQANATGPYDVLRDLPVAECTPSWMEAILATATHQVVRAEEDTSPSYSSLSPDMQRAAAEYTKRAVDGNRQEMLDSGTWEVGKFDDRGRGWEKIQADAAYKIAELVKANWSPISLEEGWRAFSTAAPTDATWTMQDVEAKWQSQYARATARAMPANLGQRTGGFLIQPGEAPAPAEGGAAPQQQWPARTWDDLGNSERLLALHGDRLRWVPERDRWARYDNGVWRLEKDAADRLMIDTLERTGALEGHNYSAQASAGKDGEPTTSQAQKFAKWLTTQRFAVRVTSAVRTLRMRGVVTASARDFDQHPMLLCVANGVINLETGELLAHDPAYLFQQQTPIAYDPAATAPMWETYLERVMPDLAMRQYLQRIVGYTLTGLTSEQVFFMHYGVTKNGKSVFLEVVEAMLGGYSQGIPPSTLMTKKFEQHPADIARMEGKRQLLLSETPQGARLDEALVKRLSGGDTVTARGMGEEFRDFKIMGKVHLVTNHLPHINHDEATMRRIRLVHWGVTIPEGQRDKHLSKRIISRELPGVLAWAVRGTLEWQKHELAPPMSAVMDLAGYVEREDRLGEFISARLLQDRDGFTPSAQIYATYRAWAESQGTRPMESSTLIQELHQRGFEKHRTATLRGLRLRIIAETFTPVQPMFQQ